MDYGHRPYRGYFLNQPFRLFVCVTLSLLLGLNFYKYFWDTSVDNFNGDISDIKYVIMQLIKGLTEVNSNHERLKTEMERLTNVLPAFAAAAGQAKEAITEPHRYGRQVGDVLEYDRQMPDYALETAGGRILDTGDTVEHVVYESPVGWALHLVTLLMCRDVLSARAVIRPGSLPGECWAFKGTRGEVSIRLLGTVRITGISMENIPPNISPTREISSAPRLFQIEGLDYRNDPYPHDYGSFEYDRDGEPIQYFEVLHPTKKGHNIVKLRVLSNWGHPVYTCVYRLRVHGELASGQGLRTAAVGDDGDMRI